MSASEDEDLTIPILRLPVEDLYKTVHDKGEERLYFYFESLILLSSKLCFARNHKAIKALKDFYNLR
jgi:hypothetical protein